MAKVVVGLMNDRQEADRVVQQLEARCRCDGADIGIVTRAGAGADAAAGGLIGALVQAGVPEDEADYFAEGVRRGGTLVTVHARDDGTAQCAAEVMRHGIPDLEGRKEAAVEESGVLPVTKEELLVGKREVSRGGVRIYTSVVERPVSESVQLREERAVVERRPADRAVAPGDQAFQEFTVEVTETAEEPVVQKRARVVEEVVVRKETTQHEHRVEDTVRKTDVHVERTGAERRKSAGPYSGQERRSSPR